MLNTKINKPRKPSNISWHTVFFHYYELGLETVTIGSQFVPQKSLALLFIHLATILFLRRHLFLNSSRSSRQIISSATVMFCKWRLFDSRLILRINVTEDILLIFKADFNSHELSLVNFSVDMSDMSYFVLWCISQCLLLRSLQTWTVFFKSCKDYCLIFVNKYIPLPSFVMYFTTLSKTHFSS